MILFILGLIIFFLPHLYTPFARRSREALKKRLGEGPYRGLYSLVSGVGFALIIIGWRDADRTVLYVSPYWLVYVGFALNLAALIFLAAAYLPKGKLAPLLKHPMLAGVKAWSFAHLLVNGDVRSVILFGSFLAYGVIDRMAVKARNAPTPAEGPFRNDLIAIAFGGALWALIYLYLHPYIAGVALR